MAGAHHSPLVMLSSLLAARFAALIFRSVLQSVMGILLMQNSTSSPLTAKIVAKPLKRHLGVQINSKIAHSNMGSGHTCPQGTCCHLVRCQNRVSGIYLSSVALVDCLQGIFPRELSRHSHLHLSLVWHQEVVVLLHEQPAWAAEMFRSCQGSARDTPIQSALYFCQLSLIYAHSQRQGNFLTGGLMDSVACASVCFRDFATCYCHEANSLV